MKFKVGEPIRNKITGQEGRVVRLADTSAGTAYIVSIILDERWGGIHKEALWRRDVVVNAMKVERVPS